MKTKDWVGLVDIVLRGEAALLENRKSGEIITLMVTLLTLLITFTYHTLTYPDSTLLS